MAFWSQILVWCVVALACQVFFLSAATFGAHDPIVKQGPPMGPLSTSMAPQWSGGAPRPPYRAFSDRVGFETCLAVLSRFFLGAFLSSLVSLRSSSWLSRRGLSTISEILMVLVILMPVLTPSSFVLYCHWLLWPNGQSAPKESRSHVALWLNSVIVYLYYSLCICGPHDQRHMTISIKVLSQRLRCSASYGADSAP